MKEKLLSILMTHKRGHAKYAIVDQALVSGMNFLTNIVLLRALGIRQFGVYTLAWAAVQFIYSVQLALVISPLLTKGPKQPPKKRAEYFGATLLQQLVFALVSSAMLYAAARFTPGRLLGNESAPIAGVLALAAFCYCVQDFVRRLLFVTQRPWTAMASDIASYAGQVALLAALAARHHVTIQSALTIMAITSLIGSLALLAGARIRFVLRGQTQLEHLQSNITFSKWLFASSLLQWSAGNLFVIAVATVLGPAGAGMLRLGQSVMGVLHIWFQGMENFIPAHAAEIVFSGGTKVMQEYLLRTAALWGAPISLYLLAVAMFPVQCLTLIYGRTIPDAPEIVRSFAFIYALMFINSLLRIELRSLEKTKPVFMSYLAGTGLSVLLAFPIARAWGMLGAVAGLALQHVIIMLILCISARKGNSLRDTACASSMC